MSISYYNVTREYKALRPPMQTMLYLPDGESEKKHIGIVIIHSNSDYLESPACAEFAKRGYSVVAANVPNPSKCLELKLLDVKRAINHLKQNVPEVDKILIFGHSGGATLMSAYQAVAEKGNQIFQGPEKVYRMPDIEDLPAADGVLLIDSNWGNGAMTLLSLDPSINDESTGMGYIPELDQLNPANGYKDDGTTDYSEDFIRKFMKAQKEREDKLVRYAQERVRALAGGRGTYQDDEPMIVPGGEQVAPCNKLFPHDLTLLTHTKGEYTQIYGDGTRKTEVVYSIRNAARPDNLTPSYNAAAFKTSVKSFLASTAVLANDDFYIDETGIYGIDYDSSYACTPGNVHHIDAPTLVMGLTAGYEFMAAEEVYRNLKAEDKTLAFVHGVNHPIRIAHYMEKFPGEFGDPIKYMFDYIAEWIDARF